MPLIPGPRLEPPKNEPRPWAANTGQIKLLELVAPASGLSARDFHLYWRNHHSPHVMRVAAFSQFIRKYLCAHRLPAHDLSLPFAWIQSPAEGVAEVWLDSVEEAGRWFSHPAYAELIAPDEARFLCSDGGVEVTLMKVETIVDKDADLAETGMIKLYLLGHRPDDMPRDRFHAACSAHAAMIAQQTDFVRLAVSHRLSEPIGLDGWPPSKIDVAFEFWFPDQGGAIEFLLKNQASMIAAEKNLLRPGGSRLVIGVLHAVHDEMSFQPTTTQPLPLVWGPVPEKRL